MARPLNTADLYREEGQAATEYAVIAFVTVFVVLAAIRALDEALLMYYQDLTQLLCLPIP